MGSWESFAFNEAQKSRGASSTCSGGSGSSSLSSRDWWSSDGGGSVDQRRTSGKKDPKAKGQAHAKASMTDSKKNQDGEVEKKEDDDQ